MSWWKKLKGRVRLGEPLKNHTSFKIGGPADFFIEPKNIKELRLLLSIKKRYKFPLCLIGAGSNILAGDKRKKGVVLRLSSACFKKVVFRGDFVEAAAGVFLSMLIKLTRERRLSGLEFICGMPGTLGGALAMNAGIPSRSIADLVENVKVMDYNGNIKLLPKKRIRFTYRKSSLNKFIILSALLKLSKSSAKEARDNARVMLKQRLASQDLASFSAGCVFKNPKGASAGKLIDLCGLKGESCGGAFFSKKHANFIINRRSASARDVLELIKLARVRVKGKFGINLKPEIKIWR